MSPVVGHKADLLKASPNVRFRSNADIAGPCGETLAASSPPLCPERCPPQAIAACRCRACRASMRGAQAHPPPIPETPRLLAHLFRRCPCRHHRAPRGPAARSRPMAMAVRFLSPLQSRRADRRHRADLRPSARRFRDRMAKVFGEAHGSRLSDVARSTRLDGTQVRHVGARRALPVAAGQRMKFASTRPFADPDIASRKLVEIASTIEWRRHRAWANARIFRVYSRFGRVVDWGTRRGPTDRQGDSKLGHYEIQFGRALVDATLCSNQCNAEYDFSSGELSQRFQFDLPGPAPPRKNIPLSPSGKSNLEAAPSHPGYERRIASRHERGVGCGGRGSVGCAMNSRADERRQCVRRSRVVLASVADVKPAEVCEPNRVFAEPLICRRR